MENEEHGPMENLLDGLDQHSNSLSSDELNAELRDRGIDLDAGLAKAEMTISLHDKKERLSWMKVADEKSASLRVAEAHSPSWTSRKAQEIVAAFNAYIDSAGPQTALAFRNKGELSVEDMAQILDANERLKRRSDDHEELRP